MEFVSVMNRFDEFLDWSELGLRKYREMVCKYVAEIEALLRGERP
jgi:hypothetical protein